MYTYIIYHDLNSVKYKNCEILDPNKEAETMIRIGPMPSNLIHPKRNNTFSDFLWSRPS